MTLSFPYRPDIDGLRAIAVLGVVLYHADIPGFNGGFVGVDIFFVISGYLITKIIADRIEAQNFSLIDFYERRVRRILPALFIMLTFCSVVAPFLLIPVDYAAFSKSMVASVLFVSNIWFAKELDYFGEIPHYDPLLHTWSLAVEEQFYILFPIFMFLIYKYYPQRRHVMMCVMALASFGLNIWMTIHYPRVAFFAAPTRAWELILGSMIALGALPPLRPGLWREALALLGLALIGGSIVLLSSGPNFPGFNALYPTAGAALVIYTGLNGETIVGRMLRARWLVFVGLVSYSLYLWHWPLIVFAKYAIIRPLSPTETATVLVASLIAAIASQKLIEHPFRRRHGVMNRTPLFSAVGGLTVAFLMTGAIGLYGGLEATKRQTGLVLANDAGLLQNSDRDECIIGLSSRQARTPADVRARNLCRLGDQVSAPSFVLWGDSHAEAIRAGVDAAAKAHGASGFFAGNLGCPPMIGTRASFDNREYGDCIGLNDAVMQLLEDPKLQTVILHARWAFFFHGTRTVGELGQNVVLSSYGEDASNKEVLAKQLSATVSRLVSMQKKVVIVAGVPEIDVNVPSFLARNKHFQRKLSISVTNDDYMRRNGDFLKILADLSERDSVKILYPNEIFCHGGLCRISAGESPLYLDDDHLSVPGALFLAPMFDSIFEPNDALTEATQQGVRRR